MRVRFALLDELPIAVVDEHERLGGARFDDIRGTLAFGHAQRAARRVTARTLNEDGRDVVLGERTGDGGQIDATARIERDLAILDAGVRERVRCVANRVAQRIVGRARDREQRPVRGRARGERRHDGVSPADDREPRERALHTQDAREQRFVTLAHRIVVAVPSGADQVALGETLVEEGLYHVERHALLRVVAKRRCAAVGCECGLAEAAADLEALAEPGDHASAESRAASEDRWRSYARTNG